VSRFATNAKQKSAFNYHELLQSETEQNQNAGQRGGGSFCRATPSSGNNAGRPPPVEIENFAE
jgi:hypothetical protein